MCGECIDTCSGLDHVHSLTPSLNLSNVIITFKVIIMLEHNNEVKL